MHDRVMRSIAVLFAAIAVTGVSAASAMAEPEFVAQGGKTFPLSFTSLGLNPELTTAKHEPIKCESNHGEGEISANPSSTKSMLGWLRLHILKCQTKGPFGENAGCQSSSTNGLILTPWYPFHIGKLLALSGGKRHVLMVILVEKGAVSPGGALQATEFKCATSPEATIKITGNVVNGLLGEFNKAVTELEGLSTQSSAGVESLSTFENTLPAETLTGLKLSVNIKTSLTNETEEAAAVVTAKIVFDGPVELKA